MSSGNIVQQKKELKTTISTPPKSVAVGFVVQKPMSSIHGFVLKVSGLETSSAQNLRSAPNSVMCETNRRFNTLQYFQTTPWFVLTSSGERFSQDRFWSGCHSTTAQGRVLAYLMTYTPLRQHDACFGLSYHANDGSYLSTSVLQPSYSYLIWDLLGKDHIQISYTTSPKGGCVAHLQGGWLLPSFFFIFILCDFLRTGNE